VNFSLLYEKGNLGKGKRKVVDGDETPEAKRAAAASTKHCKVCASFHSITFPLFILCCLPSLCHFIHSLSLSLSLSHHPSSDNPSACKRLFLFFVLRKFMCDLKKNKKEIIIGRCAKGTSCCRGWQAQQSESSPTNNLEERK